MKRSAADKAFSEFIRERDNWTCVKCGKQAKGQGLHCSHIYSRRHQSVRFFSKNAKALCFSCHQWYGGNPVESGKWVESYLGGEALEELERRKSRICKRTKKDKKEIAAHWRAQLQYLRRCRDEGRDFNVVEWD